MEKDWCGDAGEKKMEEMRVTTLRVKKVGRKLSKQRGETEGGKQRREAACQKNEV